MRLTRSIKVLANVLKVFWCGCCNEKVGFLCGCCIKTVVVGVAVVVWL